MKFNTNKFKIVILVILIIVLIASILPMLYIAQYNHPYRDDFSFSATARNAFRETGSLFKVLKASFDMVKYKYYNWQGSFSSIFLFTLQPNVFSDSLYFLSTYILLFSFIGSSLYFFYSLLVIAFGQDKKSWLIVSIIVMLACIQFVPTPVESFYWYNGSMYYLFFFSLALFLFGLIIRYLIVSATIFNPRYMIPLILLAFIVGGGNYVTALNATIVLTLTLGYLITKKNKKWTMLLIVYLSLVAAFVLSITAPGNAIRQSFFPKVYSGFGAIIESFNLGYRYVFTMFNAPKGEISIIIFMLCGALGFLTKVITNRKFKFKYPLLVVLLIFGVFCAQFTPPVFAMGASGPERLMNIIFFNYVFYLMFIITYLAGWAYNKVIDANDKIMMIDVNVLKDFLSMSYKKLIIPYLTCLVILVSCSMYIIIDKYNEYQPTSYEAVISIISGEAKTYHLQELERLEVLESDELNVVLEPLTVIPKLLKKKDYIGEGIVEYYGKESVVIKE